MSYNASVEIRAACFLNVQKNENMFVQIHVEHELLHALSRFFLYRIQIEIQNENYLNQKQNRKEMDKSAFQIHLSDQTFSKSNRLRQIQVSFNLLLTVIKHLAQK